MTECETQRTISPPGSEFGPLLKDFREGVTGLSQAKLAEKAGFDHSYVSRLESGARMPTRDAVERLAKAINMGQSDTNQLLHAAGFSTVTPAMLSEARVHLASALALLGGVTP